METLVYLAQSRLAVAVEDDARWPSLHVRSTVDPRQSFLFPLRDEPLSGGLSQYSRLGLLHAVHWALAFGAGPLPGDAEIRFEPATAAAGHPMVSPARMLDRRWWIADASGIFGSVTLGTAAGALARIPLARQW